MLFLIIMDRVDKIFLSVLFALLGLVRILIYSGRIPKVFNAYCAL